MTAAGAEGARARATSNNAQATPADVTVVIAAYNRQEPLLALLADLGRQTLPAETYEVVVVDDGSVPPLVVPTEFQARLRIEHKANGGAASARQRGAELACGTILVFLDDDMRVEPGFLRGHLDAHDEHDEDDEHDPRSARLSRVVLGRMVPAGSGKALPLHERFYAEMLARLAREVTTGHGRLTGSDVYTGNLSLPRAFFFKAGGFDTAFRHLEDAEIGVRLEGAGAQFVFAPNVVSVHGPSGSPSSSVPAATWLKRSQRDGVYATRLARKHPRVRDASPYRYLARVHPVSRPWLAVALAAPIGVGGLARGAMTVASLCDAIGLERLAIAGTTLVYGLQFYRGVRQETGNLRDVWREYLAFRRALEDLTDEAARDAAPRGGREAWHACRQAILADHARLVLNHRKYGGGEVRGVAADALHNIGFQLLIGYRVMRLFRARGDILAAKFMSRALRHAYGSDIHWEADLAPGIAIVHGFGMAIGPGVVVGPGALIYQHVTLGRGIDPETRQAGAPRLLPNVHVGIGAVIAGPIVVGEGTKIMAGAVVRSSVPANSIVETAAPTVRARPDASA